MGTRSRIGDSTPALREAHDPLAAAARAKRKLDAKTRELIALAAAVTTRCDGCIAVHAEAARKAGASKEEVEALRVAVVLNAGAALVYTARAFEAFPGEGGRAGLPLRRGGRPDRPAAAARDRRRACRPAPRRSGAAPLRSEAAPRCARRPR
jgi:AhpD family alkylhydroperoxidase